MTDKKHADKGATLQVVDRAFIKKIRIGDRLFHFAPDSVPAGGTRSGSSPATDYTLYSVVDLPGGHDVVIMGAFDTREEKKNVTHSDLLDGRWKYQP